MTNQEKSGGTGAKSWAAIIDIIDKKQDLMLGDWVKEQLAVTGSQHGLIRESDLNQQCKEFLQLFGKAVKSQNLDIQNQSWDSVRNAMTDVIRSRGEQGFSSSEAVAFIFSLKKPLFHQLSFALETEPALLGEALWKITELLDKLGLHTMEVYQKTREEVILRQQQDMLELSTPVVSLADGILALPLIGTLDSERTQVVMESLLEAIVTTGSTVAIIDITGVPTVDTLVAQHLLKTVTAARLMGADCIISGIRPQIAQTIVHLGVELGNVITKASLAAAFLTALETLGLRIVRSAAVKPAEKR